MGCSRFVRQDHGHWAEFVYGLTELTFSLAVFGVQNDGQWTEFGVYELTFSLAVFGVQDDGQRLGRLRTLSSELAQLRRCGPESGSDPQVNQLKMFAA